MVNAGHEAKLCIHLENIARDHFIRSMKRKTVKEWSVLVKSWKRQERRLTSSFKKHPVYLFALVTLIAGKDRSGDLLDFYSHCTTHN
jgi:hypothetical protein